MTDELRDLLRESAAAHRPDRARMLARVERGTARPEPPARPFGRGRGGAVSWPRVVLATLATAGALAVGSFAVATVFHAPDPPQVATDPAPPASVSPSPAPPASAPPSPSTAPTGTGTGSPPASPPPSTAPAGPGPDPGRTASGSPSVGSRATPPAAGSRTEDGPLWADGSVDPDSTVRWARSNVTLKTSSPLTALTVELRIALTEGVRSTGSRQSLPAGDFAVSVRTDGGFLVYRWTLKPGRTVPVGQHLFVGQYDHATGGRDANDDSYGAEATAARGGGPDGRASVRGDFARTG
ncbi:hypothetical protein [Streptomyces sp. NPDC058613]|uniref:hypothetical protein n=1 Tax=Streptomyces sp. NPDC058613 TaxID=3346556 RepID=UPI00365EF4C2